MKSLAQPHITEKSYAASQMTTPVYTFKVAPGFNADLVKRHVEKTYNVTVQNVRMINIPGRVRRVKGIMGRTSDTKKALVQLKAGEKIAAFDIDETTGKEKE